MLARTDLSLGLIAAEFAPGPRSVEHGCPLSDSRFYVQHSTEPPKRKTIRLQVLTIDEEGPDRPRGGALLTVSDGLHAIGARIHKTFWKHQQNTADIRLSPLCVIEVAGQGNGTYDDRGWGKCERGLWIGNGWYQSKQNSPMTVIRRLTTTIGNPIPYVLPDVDQSGWVKTLADFFVWNWSDRRNVNAYFRESKWALKVPCLPIARQVLRFLSSRNANSLLATSRAHALTLSRILEPTPSQNCRLQMLRETMASSTTEMMIEKMLQWMLTHANVQQNAVLKQPAVSQLFSEAFASPSPDDSIFKDPPHFSRVSFIANTARTFTKQKIGSYLSSNPTSLRVLFRGTLNQQAYRQFSALQQLTANIQITDPWSSSYFREDRGEMCWLPHGAGVGSDAELHGCGVKQYSRTVRPQPEHPFQFLPISLRDIAHAALKQYAMCTDIKSMLQLSQCALSLDGAGAALPITHGMAWLLLGYCRCAFPDSFLSRNIPASQLAEAAASQLSIPAVALPLPDVLSHVSMFLLSSNVATAQRYRPVSRVFKLAIDSHMQDSKRSEYTRVVRASQRRGPGSGEAFVKSFIFAINSTTVALDGLLLPSASSAFYDAFKLHNLEALREFGFACEPGLTNAALNALFDSAPQLHYFRCDHPPIP